MKKFIIGAVAAVALFVCSATESNAQYPIARGVRAAARGAVRVATPGIGPIYGPVYGPRVVVARRASPHGSTMTAYKFRLRRKRNKQSAQKKKEKERAGKKKRGR